MNRTRSGSFALGALLAAGTIAGCASAGPSKSLVRARTMQETAQQSRAEELAKLELREAEQLLEGAEREHQANPGSNMEKHLANLAAAKFEIAMADARARAADAREEQALLKVRGAEASELAEQEARLEAERQARLEAEQRAEEAQQALDELDKVAKVEEREEGTVISLTGAVLFRVDESELLPTAERRLEEVAEALKMQDEAVPIVIEGHADATGPAAYNEALSERRAAAVRSFLAEQGVSPERIRIVGRGEKEPIATNETPAGRANNRRVEIILQGEA